MWLRYLGYVAIAESASFVALLIAMVFKYGAGTPVGVEILGPIHGMLFLAFVALAIVARQQRGWSLGRTAVVLAAAVVPIAGYVVGRRILDEDTAETKTRQAGGV